MDSRKFDALTRQLATGRSRRSILKGLLGLGGAAVTSTVVAEETDARVIGTRPTIPPPPPGGCSLGQVSCNGVCCPFGRCFSGVCCPIAGTSRCGNSCCPTGQCTDTGLCCPAGQDVCRTICCPNGTCARNGLTDFCCTAATGFACGLDCCETELQCCDLECCPEGTVCLTQAFGGEGPLIEEETCCPIAQTCDEQCCPGECFDPAGGIIINDNLAQLFERECCPVGGTVCEGIAGNLCCQGETPQCCVVAGVATCIAEGACCTDADCPGTCDRCYQGVCIDDQTLCPGPCEVCSQGQCLGCPPPTTCCVNAPSPVCIDVSQPGVCCTSDQCPDSPATCQEGVCTATVCSLQSICDVGEVCCPVATGGFACIAGTACPTTTTTVGPTTTTTPAGCGTGPACGAGSFCCNGACVPGVTCCEGTTVGCEQFGQGRICCRGQFCIPPTQTCCVNDQNCPEGSICCGITCSVGECCTGIADDGRCAPGICCPTPRGNECVAGTSCEAATTTTAAPSTTTVVPCTPPFIPCNGECRICCSAADCAVYFPGADSACLACVENGNRCDLSPYGTLCPGGFCDTGMCRPCFGSGQNCVLGNECCSGICIGTSCQ